MNNDKEQNIEKIFEPMKFIDIFKKALRSGFSGSAAMTIQVFALMWMRTTMNYQYRYGGTIKNTF